MVRIIQIVCLCSMVGMLSFLLTMFSITKLDSNSYIVLSQQSAEYFHTPSVKFFVITLNGTTETSNGNRGRLKRFFEIWAKQCPRIVFDICQGQLHSVRGVGVSIALTKCAEKARQVPMSVFLEDDAIPFSNACDFEQKLRGAPNDTYILLFGGHVWSYKKEPKQYIKTFFSSGAYGFGIKQANVLLFQESMRNLTFSKIMVSPDAEIYNTAKRKGLQNYATNPLMIDHMKGAWSNTWNTYRNESWMGNPYPFGIKPYE